MIDLGVTLGTAALVMCVWNIGLLRQVLTKHPDDRSSNPDHDGDAAQHYESLVDVLRNAKRREHFAGLPPGALTPAPFHGIYYGYDRRLFERDNFTASSMGARSTSNQHSTWG